MIDTAATLDTVRRTLSPRFAPPPTPLRAVLIHGGVTVLWILLLLRAFGAGGLLAWSVGLAYVAYDTALVLFVFVQTLPLARSGTPELLVDRGTLPTLGVIIAAHNEAASLPATLAALLAQTSLPDVICIADDGSTDGTAALTQGWSGPALLWLRLPHGGKARALNAALAQMDQELVLTVDADTLLEPGAIMAMRQAFAADPALTAATGVLFPVCGPSLSGRVFQWFQTYEYMRNFLSRYAWARQDGLLLISGAFAAYRRTSVLAVGGFDPDCLVEDYELTHRLMDVGARQGWRTSIVGGALAQTEAPSTVPAFLRQRRRWFGGFLQTQLWYRHMIGNPGYGRLGTRMLPVKALDTMQPVFGLTSIVLLLISWIRGGSVMPVAGVIGAKILLDLGFYLWSLSLYRRWLGPRAQMRLAPAVLAALIEPFSFQVLRHIGATLGWVSFLTGRRQWGAQARATSRVPEVKMG